MSGIDGLAGFLLARIAEDERVARDLIGRRDASEGSYISLGLAHPELAMGDCPSHLGEYDPARVLAECEAKRQIVEEFAPCVDDGDGYAAAARNALSYLAAIYADHPDFQEVWRV